MKVHEYANIAYTRSNLWVSLSWYNNDIMMIHKINTKLFTQSLVQRICWRLRALNLACSIQVKSSYRVWSPPSTPVFTTYY